MTLLQFKQSSLYPPMSHIATAYYLNDLVYNRAETTFLHESFHTFPKFINSSMSLFASIQLLICDILQKLFQSQRYSQEQKQIPFLSHRAQPIFDPV